MNGVVDDSSRHTKRAPAASAAGISHQVGPLVRLNGVVAPTKTAVGASVSLSIVTPQAAGWPYSATRPEDAPSETVVELRPYFQWANRGPSTMRVFIPLAAE
jgi:DUF1680 family protein